jgi:flagellar motor switch protein FliG
VAASSVAGGPNVVRATLEKAVGQHRANTIVSRLGGNDQDTPEFLIPMIQAEPRELVNILKPEQPQTIALILSHLPTEHAKALLNECAPDLRDKVVERLASLSPTPIEVIEKVSAIVNAKLGFKATRAVSATGGLKSAADLLNNLNRDMSKTVLTSIEERNPDLGKAIRQKMFTFDDMLLLDNAGMQKVMREVDTRDLALALKKASEPVQKALFSAISKRAAETVKEEISFLQGVKPKDMEAAQQRIVDIVRRLEGEGELEIKRGGVEEEATK